jgi:hypothetical protein
MSKEIVKLCFLAGCLSLASVAAPAQEVVHALTGTVVSIDASAKTITVYTDDRSEGLFKDMTNPNTRIEFDKSLRIDATAADTFKKIGAYSIIFFYGGGDTRTAVAIRALGSGPFAKYTGKIVAVENKNSISVSDGSGSIQSFKLTPDTVAETDHGAVGGFKFQPHKGDQVRVTSAVINGSETALFINTLIAN